MHQGKLFGTTVSDEATWTLGRFCISDTCFTDKNHNRLTLANLFLLSEDKCLIRIILMKANREAGNCWSSLLEGEYCANTWVQEEMQKKLTLERFQREVRWLTI